MGNSFLSFLRKPVICKCGHPNKPCHRTGKWYDYSTACKECDCKFFIKRTESEKLNKVLDIIGIVGFGFIFFLVASFGVLMYSVANSNPNADTQMITISVGKVLKYTGLGCLLFAAWMVGQTFDQITLYFRVHRKEVKPIDPRWDKENED